MTNARDAASAHEKVAVVGSRKGADLAAVVAFMEALWAKQSDTLVISGGAEGVDQMAESTWYRLGGRVRSYRPSAFGEAWGVEVWEYSSKATTSYVSPAPKQGIELATFRDAALYRDTLIAETCDRLVAFYRPNGSAGTAFTESWARDKGKDVHTFVARVA